MPVPLKRRWVIADSIPAHIDTQLADYPAFFRQLLYNRGIQTMAEAERYLNGRADSYSPFALLDMDAAVDRLLFAIDHQEPIAVYGDYDVDGVTATVLMVEVLRTLGADAREYIPNRFDEGYGLNCEALSSLAEAGVRVVITVDCGIRSPKEADHARAVGLDLIISDHHHPQNGIPQACAVICQHREGSQYPYLHLAGVGLAYKIAQALFERRPLPGVRAEDWLDLVALGTVADMVPLTGENRMLVRGGIDLIRWGKRIGLSSLASVAGLNPARISAMDIGFSIGPRLNASGRLKSAISSFRLLNSRDINEIINLAQYLDDDNRSRQKLTQQMQTNVDFRLAEGGYKNLLFAVDGEFNSGVVGLVAAKLAEGHYRPAVIGARGEETTRASCRSIPEFHITNALDECSDLLVRHGGHAMAAGFTVRNENLEALEERLVAIADRELEGKDLCPNLQADMVISLANGPERNLLALLERLQPTGMDNREASFVARDVRVVKAKPVGAEKQHLRLTVSGGSVHYECIAFRQGHWYGKLPEKVDLLFRFEANEYNGVTSLQLNVRDIRDPKDAD